MTKRWYVVHAYSGFENRVRQSAERLLVADIVYQFAGRIDQSKVRLGEGFKEQQAIGGLDIPRKADIPVVFLPGVVEGTGQATAEELGLPEETFEGGFGRSAVGVPCVKEARTFQETT